MCICQRKYEKLQRNGYKTKLKINKVNSNKRVSKGFIRQYWQKYNTDGRITQYMHQIACIYIAVLQQKWKNTYL